MATYLDFEKSIKSLDEDISNAKIKGDIPAFEILKKNLQKEISKVYKNLNDYQKLQLARHPDRPYTMDYVRLILDDAYQIHGDRAFRDDKAILAYLGYIGGQKVILIGQQKGRGTKNKLKRNFGMPHPEGYRKALRITKMAEKFDIPVLFLIDTPGAFPGLEAEERGQSEAIAKNLFELSDVKTKMLSIVIGEGGSGGALALGVADKIVMMKYSVLSVISPEGCAAILWNDPLKQESATKAMKITSEDLYKMGLIDDVIDEPIVGAHRDKVAAAKAIKEYFLKFIDEMNKTSDEERIKRRVEKILSIGAYEEK
ncbi:MAG: acetyl-CoA carboxylase carboxyltransferase subunit alpha [Epsilonproteobacteria bacterium]|nr:acetyl-CoA carboxylase carboxyltransferase subunit alpha [Campylobacterota bacterium]